MMKHTIPSAGYCALAVASFLAFAIVPATATRAAIPLLDQTIILIRHGEKPPAGLGQLDCQGLNRALALPPVIMRLFGKPNVIFAPNPSVPKTDLGISYDYIRPLATIEPTAIAFGLPVDVTYAAEDWPKLAKRLSDPTYRPGTILIVWEHTDLVKLARALVAAQDGNPGIVPDWNRSDFDGIDVLHIQRTSPPIGITFQHMQEGLNGEPAACPGYSSH
jgi:hypothetical protein